jgi:hypothetical protein
LLTPLHSSRPQVVHRAPQRWLELKAGDSALRSGPRPVASGRSRRKAWPAAQSETSCQRRGAPTGPVSGEPARAPPPLPCRAQCTLRPGGTRPGLPASLPPSPLSPPRPPPPSPPTLFSNSPRLPHLAPQPPLRSPPALPLLPPPLPRRARSRATSRQRIGQPSAGSSVVGVRPRRSSCGCART